VEDAASLADNVVWAIDSAKVWAVIRRDVSLVVTPFFYFDSDSVAVRTTMRIGFGFTHPQSVVKIAAVGS
jgi:hypothetical protein